MTDKETLGPAEMIIQSLLTHTDHLYHGRPGIVIDNPRKPIGVEWAPVTHKEEGDVKNVYALEKSGRNRSRKVLLGTLSEDNVVKNGRRRVGVYRKSGLFPEAAAWYYKQVVKVWELDNEFAARWASYAWQQEHRDLKVVLAAFMLVQSRKGDPVMDEGELLFHDDDYRSIGEAMLLLQEKGKDLNPKLLLRIYDLLNLPEIAEINRTLGFGKSAKRPFLGRWPKAVEKWLRYREENPQMLEGLVKAGFRTTVMLLARRIGYKPTSDKFFEILRWKQKQASDGRRELAIGKKVKKAESWAGMSEAQICETIEKTRPNWKRIVGLLPSEVGVTRAVVAAAIESGCLSDKDLIILTPTLEDLGLLKVQEIKNRLNEALARAEDMRAANIARNVRSKELKETLEQGADKVAQKAVEEATRNLRIYFMVDISGSMEGALEASKPLIAKFLQALPLDRVHVSTFNTVGKEIKIRHASTKGVEVAFRGVSAGGGTNYGAGVRALRDHKVQEGEDAIFIFVGDEEQPRTFETDVLNSGLNPVAFGFLKVYPSHGAAAWRARHLGETTAVRNTASRLGVPCFMIEEDTFQDPYAIPRVIHNLVAATPVSQVNSGRANSRVSLVDKILKTDLLQKPAWA